VIREDLRVSGESEKVMLEGVTNTVYGNDAAHAKRLATVGGRVTISAAVETTLTVASTNEYGYLTYMRADCTVVGTTGGIWSLRIGLAGTVVLLLTMPIPAAAVGTSYCWPFPVPWKTTSQGGVFSITPNVATMGTWAFHANGFHSSI
jgi:uncharacterized membrane protein YdfJ with MMPL/SSD domain